MSANIKLDFVNHYYASGRYDEAIEYLSANLNKTSSDEENMLINIWLGKCYFTKTCSYSYSNLYSYLDKIPRRSSGVYESSKYVQFSKKMSEKALEYFEAAIHQNPNSDIAHYWKGKVLEYEGSFNKAYKCFAKAAFLSKNKQYRKKCYHLFSAYQELGFRETRPLNTITTEEAYRFCSSSNAYLRMEACQYILAHFSKLPANKIREAVLPLAGYEVVGCYLPFTGDSDTRIRGVARTIISNLIYRPSATED